MQIKKMIEIFYLEYQKLIFFKMILPNNCAHNMFTQMHNVLITYQHILKDFDIENLYKE